MSHEQFDYEVSREEWEETLPAHKREGYAERLYELADMSREAEIEERLIRSVEHAEK